MAVMMDLHGCHNGALLFEWTQAAFDITRLPCTVLSVLMMVPGTEANLDSMPTFGQASLFSLVEQRLDELCHVLLGDWSRVVVDLVDKGFIFSCFTDSSGFVLSLYLVWQVYQVVQYLVHYIVQDSRLPFWQVCQVVHCLVHYSAQDS